MATVTMNGNEYKELMLKLHELETRLEDVTNWLKACVKLEFPENSFTSWGAGNMSGNCTEMPRWMMNTMLHEVARQLMCQEVPILKRLQEADAHYYSLFATSLGNHCWGSEDVLPYFPGLEKVWEQARLSNEADQTALEEVKEDEQDV